LYFSLLVLPKLKIMERKKFLLGTTGALSGLFFLHGLGAARNKGIPIFRTDDHRYMGYPAADTSKPVQGQPAVPPYDMDLVKEFVIAGHGNFAKTQSMVKDHPNLVFSKFDWGNGDFEAAIEGAGHVGNKEIAEFLIDAGSRVTLFVLTMLGRTDLVKPVLEAYPKLIFAYGPHGFTLLHHARVGGAAGEELYAYLQQKGLKEDWVKIR
jgi:hypothetical protein